MCRNKIRQDNAGFSFVEIMIVVAIMAVVMGVAGFGLGLINGKPAQECAQKITSQIQECRNATLGKFKTTFKLHKNANNEVVVTKTIQEDAGATTIEDVTVVGERDVKVEYSVEQAGTNYTEVTQTTTLAFDFDRSSGAFLPVDVVNGKYCHYIRVSKANKTYVIHLYPLTGKVTIE